MGKLRFAVVICLGWMLSLSGFTVDCPSLAITVQPESQTACLGETVEITIGAVGSGDLAYQWRRDCAPLLGETGATLSLDLITESDYATYECVVMDDCGALTSEVVSLTPGVSLAITTQPQSQVSCVGQRGVFEVTATGRDLLYQWRRDCTPIPGEQSSTLVLDPLVADDEATYDVVVWNACGSLTSETAGLTLDSPPQIVSQPVGGKLCVGERAYMAVTVYGTSPFSYQWEKGGVPLPGETNAYLEINITQPSDAGSYTCVVTNICDSVTSSEALLSFNLPPQITEQPASSIFCEGDDITFSVSALEADAYEWRKDCVPIPGENSATLSLASVTSADVGVYSCVINNDCGYTTTTQATLTPAAHCGITDPAFLAYIATGTWLNDMGDLVPIDLNGDGALSTHEAQAVTGTLDLSGLGLTNLSGIGVFTNLAGLICSDNLLTELPGELANLVGLNMIRAVRNLLVSWPDLSGLPDLVDLDLSNNLLHQSATRSGVFPPGLESLTLNNNRLRSLPSLAGLNQLVFLSASFNLLTDTQTLVDQNPIGSQPGHQIHLERNLLDCDMLQPLLDQAFGAVFNYNPQLDFSTFPQWPVDLTVLELLESLETHLVCGNP